MGVHAGTLAARASLVALAAANTTAAHAHVAVARPAAPATIPTAAAGRTVTAVHASRSR